jgi:hypothetical protein
MPTICPFCWAREVWRYWLAIDAAFFPLAKTAKPRVRMVDTGHEQGKSPSFTRSVKDVELGAKSPYDLIHRTYSYMVPVAWKVNTQGWDEAGCEPARATYHMSGIVAWLKSRVSGQPAPRLHRLPECRALLKAAGPNSGLLESVSFRRVAEDQPGGWSWEVQVQQLILTTVDCEEIFLRPPDGSFNHEFQKIAKPGRNVVVKYVAEVLRYPRWLIDSRTPIERVVEYLSVRRGHRLTASYGRFRARKT